ncbi:MAG: nucleoside triphosphate pyrophosphohydrolase [candidate division WOR-3 bacterium]|nr:nucleoside triphosphate pyrophosphohydrolase [candidate division WOR-3 bacterium]
MKEFDELYEVMKKLRKECPWDRKQTHRSLRKYAVEEAYELVEAIEDSSSHRIMDELADMLTQVLLHTVIAEDNNEFTIKQLLDYHRQKLERRHPHVFGAVKADTSQEVLNNWVNIKKEESGVESIMDNMPRLPALLLSAKVQKKASSRGFDWESVTGVYEKIEEELSEFRDAFTIEQKEEELGDILFAVAHLGNFEGIDPETALLGTIKKFIERFKNIEAAQEKNQSLSLNEMEEIWNQSKDRE